MSNIPISSLPLTPSLDGSEVVPIVQGGTTKRTTAAAIAGLASSGAGSAFSFLFATDEGMFFPGSRLLAAESGVTTLTDGGPASTLTVGVATHGIGNTQLRQGTALSVIGNSTNALANEADIVGTASQILRVNNAGTGLGFGSIDLSQTAAVGASVLLPGNGGTGINNGASTLTLGGSLATVGAFSSTFNMTGPTNVTFPTSGTLATTSGPALPSVAQGDLLYGSAANVLSTLPKSATATRYLANTGTSNNPNWDQVNLANGVTGTLGATNGGTSQSTYATGDTLYASAANTLSKLSGNISTAKQYLSQTGSGAASAAPVWAAIAGADITGAALTEVNDTNVTLTLGGTPATSLLRATSITAGWTGQLSLSRGGTNANLTASNGGIFYSTASAGAILAGTATANQLLLSGASGAPAWSTLTHPATAAAGTILAAGSANVITATPTPTLGANGGTGGQFTLNGSTSGSAVVRVPAAAGTGTVFQLPATNGSNTFVLQTDGAGNTSWVASAGGGTVSSVSAGAGMSFSTITATGAVAQSANSLTRNIEFVIDGGGSALTTGLKGWLECSFACTITQATLLADQTGSVVVDVFKCTYANYAPPTHPASGDKITGSTPPTITSATKSQDATLTGWTTAISAGDIIAFNVNSATTITKVTISLRVALS